MNISSNTSPLETVASYAIAFLAGAITVTMTAAYGNWRAAQENNHNQESSGDAKK